MSSQNLSPKALEHFAKPFKDLSFSSRLGLIEDLRNNYEEVVKYVNMNLAGWAMTECSVIGEVISVDLTSDAMARQFVDYLKNSVFVEELAASPT